MTASADRVAAVEAVGLVKTYGTTRALDNLTLRVERGQIMALLGPNGAGKTTTVEICEGYRRPEAGTVRVFGLDPIRDAVALRPRVGVMPQDGIGAYPTARADELLRLFAGYAAHPLETAALLSAVGLSKQARVPVKRLSGGQRQRLSLALALVARPELVFLDEPTAGMDPQARRATWELLSALRADGVTVVLSTHYLDEAEQLADQVVVVDAGRVVAAGSPTELTRSGAEGQVRFCARPGLAVTDLAAVLGAGTVVREPAPGDYVVTGAVTPNLLAALTAWCAAQDVLADQLSVERRSLEDVFLDLTGHELRA